MRQKMKSLPIYNDDSSNRGQSYLRRGKRPIPRIKPNWDDKPIESDNIRYPKIPEQMPESWGIFVEYNPDYYMAELFKIEEIMREQEKTIRDLTSKIKKLKKMSLFEFDGLDLPVDYYENDIYLDR